MSNSEDNCLNRMQNLSLHNRLSGEDLTPSDSVLIPLNIHNNNSSSVGQSTAKNDDITDNTESVNNNGAKSPDDRGTTSMNPRSKRPRPTKPTASSAILEAKRIAQAKRNNTNSNPQQQEPEFEVEIIMKDHLQPARDAKGLVRKQTGVVYDMRMVQHHCLWDAGYPEKPERFSAVINRCLQLGLLDRCAKIIPRPATIEEVLIVHTQDHIDKLKSICIEENVDNMEEFSAQYDAVYIHPTTYELSLLSVGCTVDLVDAVLDGRIQNGMAIIRPPGHHAMKAEYCGYCYFNNVAVAAKKALDQDKAKKVLIVDFDVHHGQATQQMFYDDDRVLYFSTHRYEHGNFWPNLEESNSHFIGTSSGIGFNCNVPLNKIGLGNSDFLSVWHQLLLPLAYEFNPDLVIVSAGFDCLYGCFEFNPDLVIVSAGYDSLQGDEKGEMELTPQCCPHLIKPLMGLANGKVAVILEGGYCIKSLAEGAALTLRSLLGDPCPEIPKIEKPSPVLVDAVLNTTYMLRPYWNMLLKQRSANDESIASIAEKGLLHMPEVKYEWPQPKPNRYATRNCYPVQDDALIKTIEERLDRLILSTNLAMAQHKVGIVYDDVMLKHRNFLEPGHPEKPERISNIFANHVDYGLVERCLRLKPRESTEEELLLIHSQEHVKKMKSTASMSKSELIKCQEKFNSIFFNSSTYQAALVSSGSVLEVVDNVLQSTCQSGIAIVRPPGHHAEEDYPHGFCIFNNVALAAKYAITNHGLERILILDWDVHHGNGIQRMFEDDPRVLYISIHRYDRGTFFPCSEDANYTVVGKGKGTGYTVNIPWNNTKMGDTEYLAAFTNIVLPIGYEYNPQLVLVSAGFDAARGDPLGGCHVTPEGYAHMTHLLSCLANGKIILALEGGYNLTSIAYSMVLCTKALLGDPIPPLSLNERIHPGALQSIQDVLNVHSNYWTVLEPFRKYLPAKTNLIPVGSYTKKSVEESIADLELKNNNLKDELVPCSSDQSESSLSPANSSLVEPSPQNQSPEAITMTLVIGDESSPEEVGACGGGAVGGNSFHNSSVASVLLSNFTDDGCAAVYPAPWCPHLEQINKVPNGELNTNAACEDCGHTKENWVCLTCYSVCCGRFINEHMMMHSLKTEHKIAFSLADFSVWCYKCETYLANQKCDEVIRAAHLDKFGEEPPKGNSS